MHRPGENPAFRPRRCGVDAAVLAETLAVAVRALRHAGFDRTSPTRAPVTVVEPEPSRRLLAETLGASNAVDSNHAEPRSADVVVECTGNPTAAVAALVIARTGGTVVLVGVQPGTVPLRDIVERELSVRGSFSHRIDTDLADALALLGSGQVLAEPLIGLRVALGEAIGRGFPAAENAHNAEVVVHP